MSARIVKAAKELEGLPYKSYTLEIHNNIESSSVNFTGMDCWTFFETSLVFCRMLETPQTSYSPHDFLAQIE